MINELSKQIHAVNVKNGFYEDEKNIGEMLALIHSEVSEALEAHRKGKHASLERFFEVEATINPNHESKAEVSIWKDLFHKHIKDTFEDEIADAMIRLMDLAAYMGIDLEKHISLKVAYNATREYKHGKKY